MSKLLHVDLGFKPYAHQGVAHDMRLAFRFLVLVMHRRAGKTVFAILELILAALDAPRADCRYGYIAPLLKQSKSVAWDYLKHFALKVPGTTVNESELSVQFANGSRVRLFGADNPDSLRGLYFDGVVLDEVADMKPPIWGEIVRPALADHQGWAIFLGTPKGVNLFSELYQRALKGEEGWGCAMMRASETGVIPAEELEQARREMTAPQFAQEWDVDFNAAADDVLLRLDDVLQAQQRTTDESAVSFQAKILGVDVARYGGDRSSLFLRQGPLAFAPRILKDLDLMALAGQVAQVADKHNPDAIFIDSGGLGAGVCDRMRQLGYAVIGVDFGGRPVDPRFENKRAEMWWLAADWVKSVGCLPHSTELQHDLTAPRYTYANKRGCMQLESKDEMRSRGLPSPDVGDSFALTFAMPVAPRGMQRRNDATRNEYDPLGG